MVKLPPEKLGSFYLGAVYDNETPAIDKVPALIIDPKGDMTNLLLQFEDLSPLEFKKWINPDDASRKGMSVDDYAQATASKWKDGLASWGQDLERPDQYFRFVQSAGNRF